MDDPSTARGMRTTSELLVLVALLVFLLGADVGHPERVVVDVDTVVGTWQMLVGTNAGPLDLRTDQDYSELYRELGFEAVRTHDTYGPCDWTTIFPDWSADPADPGSYDFAASDQVVLAIVRGGFEVLFRLGSSWEVRSHPFAADPPGTLRDASGRVIHRADRDDFDRFAEVCRRIVMHYNDGWADGHHLGIRRWEIWNEPDLGERFWTGSPTQFRLMFEAVATTLHAHDPTLEIGGPGNAGHPHRAYREDLLQWMAQRRVPLHFYDWHYYGEAGRPEDIEEFGRRAHALRRMLDATGHPDARLVCGEWNTGSGRHNFSDTPRGAATTVSILAQLESGGVAEAYQYRGDRHPLGLVREDGTLRAAARAFVAWKLLTRYPHRLSTSPPRLDGVVVLASRSQEGSIRVLVANQTAEPRALRVVVGGRGAASWVFERHEADGWSPLEPSGGEIRLQLTPHALKLLQLRPG